ncbi:MAG TPA: hypothetical protein VKT73_12640 [Xanthobacteraceae bacterium]|nr:hypothetical protein [Xanthobacteraceae bacterium]
MVFGLSLSAYTWVHIALSLAGLASGLVVLIGLFQSKRLDGWTALFLLTTVATSVTGFGFPFDHFLPSHWVGVISLVFLAIAILARYAFRLAGAWRWIYVATAVVALFFNTFVAVAQLFAKVPALKALAPTQSEPPFAITEFATLALFIVFAIVAAVKFHPKPAT